MRTRKIEFLRPGEIDEELKKCPVAYLPVGFLEWHAEALPFGTDSLTAEYVALKSADITGGVVFPTVYCAAGRFYREQCPGRQVESFFFREEVFTALMRDYIRVLADHGYKTICIISGHLSPGFTDVLQFLCQEASRNMGVQAFFTHAWVPLDYPPYNVGHATVLETSVMMALCDSVDLSSLPPRGVGLNCREHGFGDAHCTEDGCVNATDDPRNATKEIGLDILRIGIERVSGEVLKISTPPDRVS